MSSIDISLTQNYTWHKLASCGLQFYQNVVAWWLRQLLLLQQRSFAALKIGKFDQTNLFVSFFANIWILLERRQSFTKKSQDSQEEERSTYLDKTQQKSKRWTVPGYWYGSNFRRMSQLQVCVALVWKTYFCVVARIFARQMETAHM